MRKKKYPLKRNALVLCQVPAEGHQEDEQEEGAEEVHHQALLEGILVFQFIFLFFLGMFCH
jgi:hypothetical protein